jgi:hypothetical protein
VANNQNERTWPYLAALVTIAIALLIIGIAAFVAVVSDGLPQWGLVVIQVTSSILGVVLSVAISALGVYWATILSVSASSAILRQASRRLSALELNQSQQLALNDIRAHTPPFVAMALLVGNTALIVTDKAFGEDRLTVVIASAALTVAFFVANELMVSQARIVCGVGLVTWSLTLSSVPILIMWYYSWSIQDLFDQLLQILGIAKLVVVFIVVILFILLPVFAFLSRSFRSQIRSAQEHEGVQEERFARKMR